jgi:type IV fimbrial biogenesis protein FimT
MRITKRTSGFTLIELLIVMAMVAVMMTLAVPGLRQLLANQQLSAAASDLQAAAMQARSTALKNNQRVVVQPTAGSAGAWADGYRLFTDVDQNSTLDSGTDTLVLTQQALPQGVTITKVTGTNNYFGYDGSGFLASIGGSSNATWLVSSTATDRKKYLVIERSGRAYVCDPKLVTNCPPP